MGRRPEDVAVLDDVMNTTQAAEFLGMSRQAVLYFVRKGELPTLDQGLTPGYLFARAALERFKAANEQLTTAQVAKMLDVPQNTVRFWASTGVLKCSKIGARHRFRRADVVAFGRDRGVIIGPSGRDVIVEKRQIH